MKDQLDWNKLKPYQSDQKKSFEELCFQLAYEKYSYLGTFTPIDDSGGGDGVEFYLEFPNGDIWGWQCKFFGRFSESGREAAIKGSLQRTYDVHRDKLKRWFLCSKLSLTTVEKKWFEVKLPKATHKKKQVLPDKHSVKLFHWGNSKILNLLRKYPDVHKFFFSEFILTWDWFDQKAKEVLELSEIKGKYNRDLHVEEVADEDLARVLGGPALASLIHDRMVRLGVEEYGKRFEESISELYKDFENGTYRKIQLAARKILEGNENLINEGNQLLKRIMGLLSDNNNEEIKSIIPKLKDYEEKYLKLYSEYSNFKDESLGFLSWEFEGQVEDSKEEKEISVHRDIVMGPYFTMRNYDAYLNIFDLLFSLEVNELHIKGKASKGKTHLVVHAFEDQIKKRLPAVFLFGRHFTSQTPLREQLRQLLNIPSVWSVSDFFGALDVAAQVYGTRLPFIIDGLNESIHWNTIFKEHLEVLLIEIKEKYPHIVFITTYISAYEDQLFSESYFKGEDDWRIQAEVQDYDYYNFEKAKEKYFNYYDVNLIGRSQSIGAFSDKLFLKLFCEAKQGQDVLFQREDLFDVFEEYLERCNRRILARLKRSERYNRQYVLKLLLQVAAYLWNENERSIPLSVAKSRGIFDDETLLAFEAENLLLFRNWQGEETLNFTYELLGGFLIGKHLIQCCSGKSEAQAFVQSLEFTERLIQKEKRHPMWDVILRSYSVLVNKQLGLFVFDLLDNDILLRYGMEALFEVNQTMLGEHSKKIQSFVAKNFENPNQRRWLIKLFQTTVFTEGHPLNMDFLSELLFGLSVSERDLTWSEYIRRNPDEFEGILEEFENYMRSSEALRIDEHLIAKQILWLLSTTNREVRDLATRALYWYGRRCTTEYLDLLEYSVRINDPYVVERMIASAYGVALALQTRLSNREVIEVFLLQMAKLVFKTMFEENAPSATTHILIRDYARRICEIALHHEPTLFSEKEKVRFRPPYKDGGIRNWPNYQDDFNDVFGIANPIRMDFSNYTIGSIVKGGGSYSNPPEKQKVRGNIYWRITDLGWNLEQFEDIERDIEREHRYASRGDRAKTERYGKKYSWIGFYEVAGYREDTGDLANKWETIRILNSDIDPSYPEPPASYQLVRKDLLGDRNLSLRDWIEKGEAPNVREYLELEEILEKKGPWVCLDGYISQKEPESERSIFAFIRTLLIKEKDFDRVKYLLSIKTKTSGAYNLPEVTQNHYSFFGEMSCFDEASYDNWDELEFITGERKKIVKKGDDDYTPDFEWVEGDEGMAFVESFPDEKEITIIDEETYKVLTPVASYIGPSHEDYNKANGYHLLSKELIFDLDLHAKPQSFDLLDNEKALASFSIRFGNQETENEYFTFLRKDLLDTYLKKHGLQILWVNWGEREFTHETFGKHGDLELKIFWEVIS